MHCAINFLGWKKVIKNIKSSSTILHLRKGRWTFPNLAKQKSSEKPCKKKSVKFSARDFKPAYTKFQSKSLAWWLQRYA